MQNKRYPYMLKFARNGFSGFIGHLDWIRMVQVALECSKLPVIYTEGYSPKAKLKFSPPLPVGMLSDTELVVMYLKDSLSEDIIKDSLLNLFPDGMTILDVKFLHPQPPKNPFNSINGAFYRMNFGLDMKFKARNRIVDLFQGILLNEETPDDITDQYHLVLKVTDEREFLDGQDYLHYVARLESKRTFHPVHFALAMKDYLNLPHLPQGRRLNFLHIDADMAHPLFDFND